MGLSTLEKIEKDIVNAIDQKMNGGTTPYDTEAEVIRIDGNTAWVHIPGGVTETPVALTINAQKGDKVQIRVSNGGAWITGNATSPPTDDTKADEANKKATTAIFVSSGAEESAAFAKKYAEDAQLSANQAAGMLDRMDYYAKQAGTTLEGIYFDAETSKDILSQMNQDALEAGTTLNDVFQLSVDAHNYAQNAFVSANGALSNLAVVENVVGVLDLISQHGTYTVTTDSEVQDGKWYFTKEVVDGVDTYVIVNNPTGNPHDLGYYELISIDDEIKNYVSSHLALDDDGLWLQKDNSNYRLQLATTSTNMYPAGVNIWDSTGVIASYGEETVIGNAQGFHITITANYNNTGAGRISFYKNANDQIAYISGDQLYITKSVVLQEMNVGDTVDNGSNGQWTWAVHTMTANGVTKNNLYLKWIG